MAAEAEADDVAQGAASSPKRSRDLHLIVGGMPIFSEALAGTATSRPRRSSRRSAPAPTRSGGSSRGASSSSSACRITGAGSAGERRPEQFRPAPLRIFPRPAGRLRGLQGRRRSTTTRSSPSRTWATGYDFPAFREGRVKNEIIDRRRRRPDAGLVLQHPPRRRSRTAHPRGASGSPSISNGRTRTSCSASTSAHVLLRELAT